MTATTRTRPPGRTTRRRRTAAKKWTNLLELSLAILAVLVAVRNRDALGATLHAVTHIGAGHSPEDRTLAFCILGVLLVTLVAVVKLVCQNNRRYS